MSFSKSRWLHLVLLFSLLSPYSAADSGGGYHVKLAQVSEVPRIDGFLNDSIWDEAVLLDAFTQYEPKEGGDPTEKTEAYVAYDSTNLYIGIRCFDSDPDAIRAFLTERDKVMNDDGITIFLDTFNDKKRAFAFEVNPCGVQSDGIYNEAARHRPGMGFDRIDKNWDTFFLAEASIDELGYTVEISIPFKSLRFPNAASQIWGFQIMRKIRRKNEEIYWSPRSRNVDGLLIQAGQIQFDGELEKGRNLEVMPVATGLKVKGEKFRPEIGLNIKYGLTSDLTADLTVNPDFSQIESDMPQVDINKRYDLYFPEKRPFFLEGSDFFDTPIELVYTRTIINPDWGVKMTGKMGKTTMGFLSVFDTNPTPISLPDVDEPAEDADIGSGFINIFRIKQDLFKESHIGFILTDKETGDSWGNITRDYNRVVGVDGHFKFNDYDRFSFQVVGTQSRVDEIKTDLVPAMSFNLTRNTRHLQLTAEYLHLPDDFEATSGYIQRKDIRQFRTRIGYTILPQKEWLVDIRPSIEYRKGWDFDGILTDHELRIGGFISGWRGTTLYGGFTTEMERYNGIDFKRTGFRGFLSSDPLSWLSGRIRFSFGNSIYYEDNPYLGYLTSIGLSLDLKPLTNFRLLYDFRVEDFYRSRGGEKVYNVTILSQRLNYQLSKTLSIRLITDYNDYYGELFNSLLLSWVLRPGTVFYLGYNDNQEKETGGLFRNEGRTVFFKFSYWWRT
ncbi:MAG: carbohydrate binding family 9 domain-containing protein [Acidobacteria bacterium]|nr:carbohydrate binding family 9 domain-containing protein [Acidobacteriota bacterium]